MYLNKGQKKSRLKPFTTLKGHRTTQNLFALLGRAIKKLEVKKKRERLYIPWVKSKKKAYF